MVERRADASGREHEHPHDHGVERRQEEPDVEAMGPAQLVTSVAGRIRHARLVALEPFGLAPHQARAFMIIARHSRRGDLRPSDLARRLDIAPRSVTEVVDALQDKGLVGRRRSPTDRRAMVLSLSDEGYRLFERMRDQPTAGDSGVFAPLTPGELADLTSLLRKVLADP